MNTIHSYQMNQKQPNQGKNYSSRKLKGNEI